MQLNFKVFKINKLFHKSILKKSKPHRDMKKWELPEKYIPILSKYSKKKNKIFNNTFLFGSS